MSIQGKKRETTNFENELEVGFFIGDVVAINPTPLEFKDVLGIELKEDSTATNYLGESNDGNTTLRVDFWIKETKRENKLKKVTYFLENKERTNKDGSKKQYINSVGVCSWAEDEDSLPVWFKEREYRVAHAGEEDLYGFVRTWLRGLDFKDPDTILDLNWKTLMKGNVKVLKEQIDGEFANPVMPLATVKTVVKEDETKEYQNVYNKAILPDFCLKFFRLKDYSNLDVLEYLKKQKPKDLKIHEKFVVDIMGEYGCKDTFSLKEIHTYDPSEFLVGTNKVIENDDASY